jgi:hypothetical protein
VSKRRKPAPALLPLSQRASLLGLPPPGSPFAGISGTHAPAKNTSIPNLTARVALAQAQRQRLTQGGLLTPQQRSAESKAAGTLATAPAGEPPASRTKAAAPAARSRTTLPTSSRSTPSAPLPSARKQTATTLPAWLTRPAVSLADSPSSPLPRTPAPAVPTGRRGAPPLGFVKGQGFKGAKPLFPGVGDALGAAAGVVEREVSSGLRDPLSALLPPGGAPALHALGVNVTDSAAQGLAKQSLGAAAKIQALGQRAPNISIPTGELVGTANAGVTQKKITLEELRKLEARGVDLSPRLVKAFDKMALKRGWNPAELDGISASARIDKAYSDPPIMPLRLLQNTGSGLVRLGAIPAAGLGIVKETAAGRGLGVAQALGEGLISEVPFIGKHKTTDTAVADPLGFFTQFAGVGKTAGAAAGLARGLRAAEQAARVVETASSGLKVPRGTLDRNAWTASGQLLVDKGAAAIPALGRRAEGEPIHTVVRRVTNEESMPFVEHGQAYAHALHDVGDKRASELLAYQQAGGEPGRLAKFYAGQHGEAAAGQAKALARIAQTTQHLSDKDEAFLAAHSAIAEHTSQAYVGAGRFGETAMKFRAYSPLIRSAAHAGDPDAQQILAMRSRLYGDSNDSSLTAEKLHAQINELERELKKHQDAYGAAERVSALKPPRRPAGSGAAAQQLWRQQRKAWEGRARQANTRMRTHSAAADRILARAEALSRRERSAEALGDPQHAALEGAYSHAVDEFIAGHEARGGMPPARVAYSQPPQTFRSPFAARGGIRTGFKQPTGRQPFETGAAFESGRYLIDPRAPLTESLRAQAAHVGNLLHTEAIKEVGQRAEAGAVRPAGYVYVSDKNLASARRTTHDLADNPVSMHDYHEAEALNKGFLRDNLTAAARQLPTGERVPRGETGWFIQEGSFKTILAYTEPGSRHAYDRAVRAYQRVLISYRPSTVFNNTFGSMPLAMLGGAGPKSFYRAAKSMLDPTTAPPVLRGRGVAGAAAREAKTPVGAAQQWLRKQSQRGEDFSRLAAYWSKAGKGMGKRARELDMTLDEYARSLAAGKVDRPLQERAMDHAEKFLSDQLKPDGRVGAVLGRGIMFHRWVGHIAKLLLVTLPVHHPRRAMILNTLAQYGDDYRKQHGVWPDWYTSHLPLFQHVERLGSSGTPQVFTRTFGAGAANPFSTLESYGSSLSTADDPKEIVRSALNPIAQAGFNTLFGPPDYSPRGTSRLGYVAAQGVRAIPGVTVVRPQGGMAPDSIPFLDEHDRQYAGLYRGSKLPRDFRPNARPLGGVEGALARYFLGGFYDVPAQGPIHNIEQRKHRAAAKRGR